VRSTPLAAAVTLESSSCTAVTQLYISSLVVVGKRIVQYSSVCACTTDRRRKTMTALCVSLLICTAVRAVWLVVSADDEPNCMHCSTNQQRHTQRCRRLSSSVDCSRADRRCCIRLISILCKHGMITKSVMQARERALSTVVCRGVELVVVVRTSLMNVYDASVAVHRTYELTTHESCCRQRRRSSHARYRRRNVSYLPAPSTRSSAHAEIVRHASRWMPPM